MPPNCQYIFLFIMPPIRFKYLLDMWLELEDNM